MGVWMFNNMKNRISKTSVPIKYGFVFWCIAVILAFTAQYLIQGLDQLRNGYALYGLASIFIVIGTVLINKKTQSIDKTATSSQRISLISWRTPRGLAGLVLVIASVLTIVISICLNESNKLHGHIFWWWIVSLLMLTLGVFLYTKENNVPSVKKKKIFSAELMAIFAIMLIAFAARWIAVDQIPPIVHADEALTGMDARSILHGDYNIFSTGWSGHPRLNFGMIAMFMRIFGDNIYGLRMASVVLGTLSVLLLYLVVKTIFSSRVALIAAFLTAVSQFNIHYSRTSINSIQAAFTGLLVFYFLLRAIKKQNSLDFLFAGFAIAFCFEVYMAARLTPILAFLFILHKIIFDHGFLKRHMVGFAILVLGTLMFIAPMATFYFHHPDSFFARSGVFIFNKGTMDHLLYKYHEDNVVDVIGIQFINTIETFNYRNDGSTHYGGRLMDFWTSALLVLGVVVATLLLRDSRYFLLAIWFWLTIILGSVLTNDALFSPHIVGLAPWLLLFPAIVIDTGWRAVDVLFGKIIKYSFFALVMAFVLLSAHANYVDYFNTFSNSHPADIQTTVSKYIATINDNYRVYTIGGDHISLKFETQLFLLPNVDGVDIRDQNLSLPLDLVPAQKGAAFIIQSNQLFTEERLSQIKQTYTNGTEELHKNILGNPLFYSYLVDHDHLMSANPRAVPDKS